MWADHKSIISFCPYFNFMPAWFPGSYTVPTILVMISKFHVCMWYLVNVWFWCNFSFTLVYIWWLRWRSKFLQGWKLLNLCLLVSNLLILQEKILEKHKLFHLSVLLLGLQSVFLAKIRIWPSVLFSFGALLTCDVSQKSHSKIAQILWVMFEPGLLSLIWLFFAVWFCWFFKIFLLSRQTIAELHGSLFFFVLSLKCIISPAFLGSSQNAIEMWTSKHLTHLNTLHTGAFNGGITVKLLPEVFNTTNSDFFFFLILLALVTAFKLSYLWLL